MPRETTKGIAGTIGSITAGCLASFYQDMIGETLLWVILGLSLLVLLWSWDSHIRFRWAVVTFIYGGKRFPSTKMTIIRGKNYHNDTVTLDGNEFRNCEFSNVTFVFHGYAPFRIIEPRFRGSLRLRTDSIAASDYSRFNDSLSAMLASHKDVTSFMTRSGTIDDDGRFRSEIVIHHERKPPPEKK